MTGLVEILNVGEGDTKLTFDKDKPEERKRAARIVADMLKRGYALLVQVGKQDGEPIYRRAKAFDPETCEYIIAGGPDEEINIGTEAQKKKARKQRRVSADKTRAVSVGRTAGG